MSKRIRIVKKKKTTFDRFECHRHLRLGRSWRRPRGIDCRVRRKYRGVLRTPKVGYGSNKKTRNLLPNYKLKFVVNNMKVIEVVEVDKEEKEVNIKVNGDVKLYFITKGMYGNSNKDIYSLFSMCEYMTSFNTFFEKEKSIIELNDKKDIDKIYKINSPSKYDKIKISIGLNNK